MSQAWTDYLLLFGAGAIAGTLNVIAGGGSMLTLPLMIFLGLPATVANGTNRLAILVQNVGAVWSFHRHRVIDWTWLRIAALPGLAGAIFGTWAAVAIGDVAFQRILAAVMLAIAIWTILDPLRGRSVGETLRAPQSRVGQAVLALAFLLVGAYGGFMQAGIGFLILAVITLAGLDLVRGNALKVLFVLAYTPVVLLLFAINGKVDWPVGAALAVGNLVGGLVGVRLTVLKGHAWIKRVVTVTVLVFAIQLWLSA